MKKRLLLGIIFSLVFMGFLLSRVEWRHFSVIAGRVDPAYIAAAFGVFLLGNLVRSFRFIHLDHMNKKLSHWWSINAFYNFLTATLPGGAGEAATAYVMKRFSNFDYLGAFRILFLTRLMDLSAISALFLIAALSISAETPYRSAAIWISGGLFLLSVISLIPASERFIVRLLKKIPGDMSLIQKLSSRMDELLKISKERNAASYLITLVQSLLNVMGGVFALHMLLQSFGVHISLVQSFYCYGVYSVFQIIPVQGIGGIGTQPAWWALALNTAGYNSADAIALGIVLHGMFYLFIGALGITGLLIGFGFRKYN